MERAARRRLPGALQPASCGPETRLRCATGRDPLRPALIWALLPFVLLPLGWLLMWTHNLIRHRWLRTRESRSDLAGLHLVTAFVLVVLFVLLAFTGLVMRGRDCCTDR